MANLLTVARDLLAWTRWANRTQLKVLQALPEEDAHRDAGASFGSLHGTLAHVLGSELMWFSRFMGAPLETLPGAADYPTVADLDFGFQELWMTVGYFLASLTEEQLSLELAWTNTTGQEFNQPLWQPLFHMVQHSSYHRGQVTSLVRQLGYEPPSIDLVYFLANRSAGG